jgi:hypothetical protein
LAKDPDTRTVDIIAVKEIGIFEDIPKFTVPRDHQGETGQVPEPSWSSANVNFSDWRLL